MKVLIACLVLVSATAHGESSSILFSDKFDAKIKALESYTVTYNQGRKAQAPKQKKDNLDLKLLKKKS